MAVEWNRSLDSSGAGLIERDAELAQVRRALDSCRSGVGLTLLIEGEAGCGKTEMLDTVLREASGEGFAVLQILGNPADSELPLSSVQQLLGSPVIPASTRDRLRPLLAVAVDSHRSGVPVDSAGQLDPVSEFLVELHELSKQRPVVVGIDDVHFLDSLSKHYLRYAARHLRYERVLFICTGSLDHSDQRRDSDIESIRNPGVHRLSMDCLSRAGVSRLLQAETGVATAPELVDSVLELTGGNPLMIRAWLTECRTFSGTDPDCWARLLPAPDGALARMASSSLRRLRPPTREVAAMVSVLAEHASAELVAGVLGMSLTTVRQELRRLDRIGLMLDLGFRSTAIRQVVCEHLDESALADLHWRAARYLDGAGAPVLAVADHLLAAEHSGHLLAQRAATGSDGESADNDWAITVIQNAASHALRSDLVQPAIGYLEFARRRCSGQLRGQVLARLAAVTWRVDPAAAERYLGEAVEEVRSATLSATAMDTLANIMFSTGRIDEALEILDRHSVEIEQDDSGSEIKSHSTHMWESVAIGPPADVTWGGASVSLGQRFTTSFGLLATSAVWTAVGSSNSSAAVRAAERLLAVSPLTDKLLPAILNALKVLAFADRARDAETWTRKLIDEADRRKAPGWAAMLSSVLVEVQLLQADFAGATGSAHRALTRVPIRDGSRFVVPPLAGSILAETRLGRYVEAARQLDRPLPSGLFSSVDGLGYLNARGNYYLATECYHAALDDFITIGRIVKDWGADQPALVPWRLAAAEACLRLDEAEQAEQLVAEQLAAKDATNSRTRGITLRLQAATLKLRLRPGPLVQAIEELQRSGDRYELARVFADLGEAYQDTADRQRALTMKRKAWALAKQCGAEAFCDSLFPPAVQEQAAPQLEAPPPIPMLTATETIGGRTLSESEHRVASLAARGFTNREIASRLFVTKSTVEQHLTRVYRKLGISRRQDLPDLELGTEQQTA